MDGEAFRPPTFEYAKKLWDYPCALLWYSAEVGPTRPAGCCVQGLQDLMWGTAGRKSLGKPVIQLPLPPEAVHGAAGRRHLQGSGMGGMAIRPRERDGGSKASLQCDSCESDCHVFPGAELVTLGLREGVEWKGRPNTLPRKEVRPVI